MTILPRRNAANLSAALLILGLLSPLFISATFDKPRLTEFVGTSGAILIFLSGLPQALQIIRTKDVRGINLTMYALFTSGVAWFLWYGIRKDDTILIIQNIFTLMPAFIIFTLTYLIKIGRVKGLS